MRPSLLWSHLGESMRLIIAIPFIVAGEVLAEMTNVCDLIAGHLTKIDIPVI